MIKSRLNQRGEEEENKIEFYTRFNEPMRIDINLSDDKILC